MSAALELALRARRRGVITACDLRFSRQRAALAQRKGGQRLDFERYSALASERYEGIRRYQPPELLLPFWRSRVEALERDLAVRPPFDFLRHPIVLATMVVLTGGRTMKGQTQLLESFFDQPRLIELVQEDYVGDPVLMESRYGTSHQAIHHLYHLARFSRSTGIDPASLDTMVEWGCGYGNLAKLFRRLHGGRPTQVLIDLPLFSLLQWLYLGVVFGFESVHLLESTDAEVVRGKINLVPVGLADAAPLRADLFVSTWAISESARPSQDYVLRCNWFGARHLLLACQNSNPSFPDAERISQLASAGGGRTEPVEVLQGSHYTFR